MSCNIVTAEHINVMLHGVVNSHNLMDAVTGYGAQRNLYWTDCKGQLHHLDADTADKYGQMLLDANYASVNARYDENNEAPAYRYTRPQRPAPGCDYTPADVIKAVSGYMYQTCEMPDWHTSTAQQLCHAIVQSMAQLMPAVDDSSHWSIAPAGAAA